jgi:hypothetical protein
MAVSVPPVLVRSRGYSRTPPRPHISVNTNEKEDKKMTDREQYALGPADKAQFRRFWGAHVDALERHLSANMWGLLAVTVVLIAYPIARFVIPAVLQAVVPDVVRTVLNLI